MENEKLPDESERKLGNEQKQKKNQCTDRKEEQGKKKSELLN